MRIQGEVRIPGNRKVVYGECVKHLASFDLRRRSARCAELGKTVGDVEDEDDESPVCGSFDFKVAEERVGAEEI